MTVSPDGATAASVADDQTVRLWHLASGRLLRTLAAPEVSGACAVSFTSSGRLLALAGHRQISIWEVRELITQSAEPAGTKPELTFASDIPLMNGTFLVGQPVFLACGAEDSRAPR